MTHVTTARAIEALRALLPHASTQAEMRRLERALAVLTSDEDEDNPAS